MIVSDEELKVKSDGGLTTKDSYKLVDFVHQLLITFTLEQFNRKQTH